MTAGLRFLTPRVAQLTKCHSLAPIQSRFASLPIITPGRQSSLCIMARGMPSNGMLIPGCLMTLYLKRVFKAGNTHTIKHLYSFVGALTRSILIVIVICTTEFS